MKHYQTTIVLISKDELTSFLIRDYFDLPRKEALISALLSRDLGQADLVKALLHFMDHATNHDWWRVHRHYVHRLVGRPIQVGPPCLLKYKANGRSPSALYPKHPHDRRIVWTSPHNPRQPGTMAHLRWADIKVGRTISQLRARGHKLRDIHTAIKRGWIRIENETTRTRKIHRVNQVSRV